MFSEDPTTPQHNWCQLLMGVAMPKKEKRGKPTLGLDKNVQPQLLWQNPLKTHNVISLQNVNIKSKLFGQFFKTGHPHLLWSKCANVTKLMLQGSPIFVDKIIKNGQK